MEDAAFEEIYRETARPLWAYIARISGQVTTADDILQETYLRFLRSSFKGDDLQEAKPYLYKIATNLVYKQFNKMKSRAESEYDQLTENEPGGPDLFKEKIEMEQIFARLKKQERALLWLACVEGYDHREIAEILKLNSLSVRVLLFRARRKLERLLESKKK